MTIQADELLTKAAELKAAAEKLKNKGKFYGKNKLWKFDVWEFPQREQQQAPQTVTAAKDENDLPF